ncbi:Proteasome activator complex subunit 4, partial [Dissostichus eleginoides]
PAERGKIIHQRPLRAESSRETRLLDHTETPLSLAAAPLARHFYCHDLGPINQPVAGPSARLLPAPALLPSPNSSPYPGSPRPVLLQQHPQLTELKRYTVEKSHQSRFLYFLERHMHLSRPSCKQGAPPSCGPLHSRMQVGARFNPPSFCNTAVNNGDIVRPLVLSLGPG